MTGNNRRAFYNAIYSKRNLKIHRNQNIINIYRIQAYASIMCEYFCTGFIAFMLKGKTLLDDTNLFPPNEYE